jgi:hypothetical protein
MSVRRNACVLACAGAVNGNVVSEQSLRIKAIPAIFPFGKDFSRLEKVNHGRVQGVKRTKKLNGA